MFKKILIATDGSGLMRAAIKYVSNIFMYSDFHIISVVDTTIGSVQPTKLLINVLEERAQSAIDKAEKILLESGIKPKKLVISGNPIKEILKYAIDNEIDLLVIGSMTKRGFPRLTFGRIGDKVVRKIVTPVLIFNTPPKIIEPKRILSATDCLIHSEEANEVAIGLAKYFGAKLSKYYVGKDKDKGQHMLEEVARTCESMGVKECGALDITEAEIGEEIVGLAENFDIIVIGKGKKSLFHKNHLVFAAREVAAMSPIPVILVGK